MMTAMIQHVALEVRPEALERCLAFYGLLGFTPASTPPTLAGRAVWLSLGPTQLHLMPRPGTVAGSGHLAVLARDYDDTVARLHRAGHEVEPRRPHWGASRGYVRDPGGHLVELIAAAPDG
jgi:catechol 2,3-dioxygenase-like lactoylglutathione lyase family enzyme